MWAKIAETILHYFSPLFSILSSQWYDKSLKHRMFPSGTQQFARTAPQLISSWFNSFKINENIPGFY